MSGSAHPDLTARVLEVSVGLGLSGPYVASVRADGLRLYGRFVDGQLSLGALDKFRDPTDKSPFALPDMAVRLSDARARIETPWGNVGAALNGGGNLRRDFAGTLALVAPRVAAADCRGMGITFYGKLGVRDVRPRLTGPLRGESITCGGAQPVAVAAPQIALDVSLADNLRQWDGTADALVQRLTMPRSPPSGSTLIWTFMAPAFPASSVMDSAATCPEGGKMILRAARVFPSETAVKATSRPSKPAWRRRTVTGTRAPGRARAGAVAARSSMSVGRVSGPKPTV